MRAALIFNAAAGRVRTYIPALHKPDLQKLAYLWHPMSKERLKARMLKSCADVGLEISLYETKRPGDATRIARICKEELVIVAGGDGTINEAVNGIGKKRLAIIPVGTANVLALQLGIPFDVRKAVAVAASNTGEWFDLGVAGKRRFLLMAGVGFDAYVVQRLHPTGKRLFGAMSYVVSAIQALGHYSFPPLAVSVDGKEPEECSAVILANAPYYAGEISLVHQADMRDGILHAALLRGKRADMLAWLAGAVVGRKHGPYVSRKGKRFTINAAEQVPVQIDGEFIGHTPIEIRVLPRALRIVVPKK